MRKNLCVVYGGLGDFLLMVNLLFELLLFVLMKC